MDHTLYHLDQTNEMENEQQIEIYPLSDGALQVLIRQSWIIKDPEEEVFSKKVSAIDEE